MCLHIRVCVCVCVCAGGQGRGMRKKTTSGDPSIVHPSIPSSTHSLTIFIPSMRSMHARLSLSLCGPVSPLLPSLPPSLPPSRPYPSFFCHVGLNDDRSCFLQAGRPLVMWGVSFTRVKQLVRPRPLLLDLGTETGNCLCVLWTEASSVMWLMQGVAREGGRSIILGWLHLGGCCWRLGWEGMLCADVPWVCVCMLRGMLGKGREGRDSHSHSHPQHVCGRACGCV